MRKFLLDANVFIEAYKRYYSFDIVPAFWNALIENAEAGFLASIDRIFLEIDAFDAEDDLKLWANNEFFDWFMSTDDELVLQEYRKVITWVMEQTQFSDAAKAEFASVADSWLIAYSKAYDFTIVTNEQYQPHIKRRIPIPNVCNAFSIDCVNTFEMLRALNVKLG
jgi:hypothetical protein